MTAATEEVRLQALGALGLLDTPDEERFNRIVRIARRVFDVPTVLVSLVDEDRQFHKARLGFEPREIPRSQSFCHHTIQGAGPMVVTDASQHPVHRDNPLVTADQGIRFYAGQPLRTLGGATVGALCIIDSQSRQVSAQDLDVLRDLADLVEAELARTDEMDRAGEVQRKLLPRVVPEARGYDLAGACLPAASVGGDFYDWYWVRDGLQVAICDVMGKGVPAAIIASSLRSLLRGASRFNDIGTAVDRVAADIADDLADTDTFATMFAARLDVEAHRLSYVDAGHGIAGVVRRGGAVVPLMSDDVPLGLPRDASYAAGEVDLEPGDTFVCVSDGLLDLFDTFDEAVDGLRRTVTSSRGAREVVDRLTDYGARHGATDDLTVVVVRRDG